MANIVLRDEVWEEGTFTYHDGTKAQAKYRHKGRLHATRCDACTKIFRGEISDASYISRSDDSKICLTMSKFHEAFGSQLSYDICSVKCGLDLVDGLWKEMHHYSMDPDEDGPESETGIHPFVTLRAKVKSYEISVCSEISSRRKLLKMWNDSASLPDFPYKEKATSFAQVVGGDGGEAFIEGGQGGAA